MDMPSLAIFRCNFFSIRSPQPHLAASVSLRKNVSIASTSSRITANEGRRSGRGENIFVKSVYAASEIGSTSYSIVRSTRKSL